MRESDESSAALVGGAAHETRGHDPLPAWLPWTVFAVYGICALTVWSEPDWRLDWDSAIYLLTGRSIAAGEGYRYLGETFFLRPPGLAWLLSLFMAPSDLGPTGIDIDFALMNRLFMLSATAAIVAVYIAFRRERGRGWALTIALLTGTSPIFVDQFNFILSALPFLALLLPALTLLDRGARGGLRAKSDSIAGALLLVLAIYLRTVAIVALPALVLSYLRRRRGRHVLASLLPIAIVCGLTAPWLISAQLAAQDVQRPAEQLYLFDYTTALLHRDQGDPSSPLLTPADWALRVEHNAGEMAGALAGSVLGSEQPAAIALLLALVAAGLVAAIRRGVGLIDWFALIHGVVLLCYFTFSPRLLLPLVPAVYAYIISAIVSISHRGAQLGASGCRAARATTAVALILAALGNAVAFPDHRDIRSRSAITARHWKDMTAASEWIRKNTARDAIVLAAMAPVVSVLSGRITYTGRHARGTAIIDRYGIDYAIAFQWIPNSVRRSMEERSIARWKLSSATPGKSTHIYRIHR